jgi:hypothetical protein
VEKPSSRGVSSLHRWSLMLLPVLWPMPLCALCTHVCVSTLVSESTQLSVVPHCCSFSGAGSVSVDALSLILCSFAVTVIWSDKQQTNSLIGSWLT